MSVPVEALPRLKCHTCNKYLSYFPIYISQNNLPICGRCSEHLKEENTFIRCRPYESICEFLEFPCIFELEGCLEKLKPNDVPNHEKNCPFRIISCLMDCMWHGTVKELHDHFLKLHPDSIINNNRFEVDFLKSYDLYDLLIYEDEIFMFRRKFDEETNILKCSLSCYRLLDSVTKYKYEITVKNEKDSISIKLPPQSADCFLENVTEINAEEVRKSLNDPSVIIGTVKISKVGESPSLTKKPNPDINVEMLTELECPVCLDYIIPPIFQCVTGHSICGDCKSQITECPLCKGELKNTQNFTLEKMALFLTYPCRFTEHGCDFASKPAKIKQHQKYCIHGPHRCPIADYENCSWKSSAKNMYAHVAQQHIDNILDIDTVTVFMDFQTEERTCYIKKFSNFLFKLHYLYKEETFYWSMQLIGPEEEADTFKFEIDIIDNTDNNQRMFVRSACAPLAGIDETFTIARDGKYVFFKLDQIRSFITDQLSYRVRIIK